MTKTPATTAPTIEKVWDGNEAATERRGRIYTSRGRWQWIVRVDGQHHSAHDLRRDAVAAADAITRQAQPTPADVCSPHAFEWSPCYQEYVCGKCGETRDTSAVRRAIGRRLFNAFTDPDTDR